MEIATEDSAKSPEEAYAQLVVRSDKCLLDDLLATPSSDHRL